MDRLRELVVESRDNKVVRFELSNLNAVIFVLVGFLGDGVAASTSVDPQAKGLAEYLRAKEIDLPAGLLAR